MRAFVRAAGSTAILLCLLVANAATTAATPDALLSINIPAGQLTDALDRLGDQSGVQIMYEPALAEGIEVAAITGTLTVSDALSRLLARTGLRADRVNDTTVVLKRAETKKASAPSPTTRRTSAEDPRAEPEEIIVSAQKQGEERLQDVPVPVTAINAQQLADNGLLRLRDYFSSVPGLSLSPDVTGYQNVAIRGITTGRASIPTTGMMIDDVPFGISVYGAGSMPDIDPSDLARIEVLRGPQGTLYGANSMGGLVRYVTLDPSTEGPGGRVTAGINSIQNGNDIGYNVRASANIPLDETLAIRTSGFTREDPGYIDSRTLRDKGINTVAASGGLLSALWRPSSTASLKLSALYEDTHGDGSAEVDRLAGDLQQNLVPGAGPYDRTIQAYSAVLKAQWGRVDFESITGYNVNHFLDATDSSLIYLSPSQNFFGVTNSIIHTNARAAKFAQELRLSAPLGEKLEAFLGAFYTDEKFALKQFVPAVTPTGAVTGTLAATDTFVNNYEEYAAFANLTYHFTDRFDVQIGGRQSHAAANQPPNVHLGALYGGQTNFPRFDSTTDVFTYLVTPRFKVSPDLMVYARLASGYRPGLFNPNQVVLGVPATYKSDSIRNYELGVKGNFLEHRLSIDASLYYIDWQNLQLQVSNAQGFGYRTNGSGAKSEGVELSTTLRPLTGLSIDASFGYNNAVLTDAFPTGSPVRGAPGDRLPFSSRYTGNVSFQQEFPLWVSSTGFVGGSVSYVDDRFGNFRGAAPPRQRFPAYTNIDFNAGLEYAAWTTSLFVNNVADKRGILSEGFYPPYRTIFIQPRTIGVSVAKSF